MTLESDTGRGRRLVLVPDVNMPDQPHRQRHLPASGVVASQDSPSTAAPAVFGISNHGKALPVEGTTTMAADVTIVVVSYNDNQHGGGEPERGEEAHATNRGQEGRPCAAETDDSRREPDEAELYRLGLDAAAEMDAAELRAEVDRFLGADQEKTPAQRRQRQGKEAPSFSYQLSDEQAWADVKAVYGMVPDSSSAGGAKAGKKRRRR